MIEILSAIRPVSILTIQSAVTRLFSAGLQAWLLALLAVGLIACESEGKLLTQSQYRSALVGQWQGNVGDESESITFEADGSFSSRARSNGFIGATLDQGITAQVHGSWTLQGDVIKMAVNDVSNQQAMNLPTVSTIVSFHENELVVQSDSGETSTFSRAR